MVLQGSNGALEHAASLQHHRPPVCVLQLLLQIYERRHAPAWYNQQDTAAAPDDDSSSKAKQAASDSGGDNASDDDDDDDDAEEELLLSRLGGGVRLEMNGLKVSSKQQTCTGCSRIPRHTMQVQGLNLCGFCDHAPTHSLMLLCACCV